MRRSSHSFVAIPSVGARRSEVLGAASARVDSAGVESGHMHTDICRQIVSSPTVTVTVAGGWLDCLRRARTPRR